jgi:hypothetical protein
MTVPADDELLLEAALDLEPRGRAPLFVDRIASLRDASRPAFKAAAQNAGPLPTT